jgi:hypothetical protein
VDGIESKNGEPPSLKWAHIDIAGSMEVIFIIHCSGVSSTDITIGKRAWPVSEDRDDG